MGSVDVAILEKALWDPSKHPRLPAHGPGGGRFRSIGAAIDHALTLHGRGEGHPEPLHGVERRHLLDAARRHGVSVAPRTSDEHVARALLNDAKAKAGGGLSAKPKTHLDHLDDAKQAIASGRHADAVDHLIAAENAAPDKATRDVIAAQRRNLAATIMHGTTPAPLVGDARRARFVALTDRAYAALQSGISHEPSLAVIADMKSHGWQFVNQDSPGLQEWESPDGRKLSLLLPYGQGVKPVTFLRPGGHRDSFKATREYVSGGVRATPHQIVARLNQAKTVDEAHAMLAGKSIAELRDVAAAHGAIPLPSRLKKKDDIARHIAEQSAGKRLADEAARNASGRLPDSLAHPFGAYSRPHVDMKPSQHDGERVEIRAANGTEHGTIVGEVANIRGAAGDGFYTVRHDDGTYNTYDKRVAHLAPRGRTIAEQRDYLRSGNDKLYQGLADPSDRSGRQKFLEEAATHPKTSMSPGGHLVVHPVGRGDWRVSEAHTMARPISHNSFDSQKDAVAAAKVIEGIGFPWGPDAATHAKTWQNANGDDVSIASMRAQVAAGLDKRGSMASAVRDHDQMIAQGKARRARDAASGYTQSVDKFDVKAGDEVAYETHAHGHWLESAISRTTGAPRPTDGQTYPTRRIRVEGTASSDLVRGRSHLDNPYLPMEDVTVHLLHDDGTSTKLDMGGTSYLNPSSAYNAAAMRLGKDALVPAYGDYRFMKRPAQSGKLDPSAPAGSKYIVRTGHRIGVSGGGPNVYRVEPSGREVLVDNSSANLAAASRRAKEFTQDAKRTAATPVAVTPPPRSVDGIPESGNPLSPSDFDRLKGWVNNLPDARARTLGTKWADAVASGDRRSVSSISHELAVHISQRRLAGDGRYDQLASQFTSANDKISDVHTARSVADMLHRLGTSRSDLPAFKDVQPGEVYALGLHQRAGIIDSPEDAHRRLLEWRKTGQVLPPVRKDAPAAPAAPNPTVLSPAAPKPSAGITSYQHGLALESEAMRTPRGSEAERHLSQTASDLKSGKITPDEALARLRTRASTVTNPHDRAALTTAADGMVRDMGRGVQAPPLTPPTPTIGTPMGGDARTGTDMRGAAGDRWSIYSQHPQAVARRAAIDRATPTAAALGDLHERVGNQVDAAVLQRSLASHVQRGNLNPAEADQVMAAYRGGGHQAASKALARIETSHGLIRIGNVDQRTSFDPSVHKPIGSGVRPGSSVYVVRPGHRINHHGEDIILDRALVEE